MKTNWQDPLSGEIISPDIAGLQEAVGKLEDALDMKVVNATGVSLEEIYISENDHYRIYQAPGKRNWVFSPAPVIKVNGTPISSGFTVNYGGGAVVFEPPLTVADVVTADFSYVTNVSNGLDAHLADYDAHLADYDAHLADYDAHLADYDAHLAENAQKHITESGENTNGRYIKFDDGTQICWFQDILNFTISSPYGSLYLGNVEVYYPKTFVGIPNVCVGSCRHGAGASWGTAYDIKSTYFMMRVIDIDARTDQNLDYGYVAIGRWK